MLRLLLVGAVLVSATSGCNGTWRLAPPPDTGMPSARTTARNAHRHVHVPGEVRGERLAPVFVRSVAVTLYQNGEWLTDSAGIEATIAALESLAPTHVSSLFRFAPDERPTARHLDVWRRAREQLAAVQPQVRFDVALDALLYVSGPDVVAHMRELDESLAPDLWYFLGWDEAEREAFDVVASATAQAHANGQAIGGLTVSDEIASDSDFGVLAARSDSRGTRWQLERLRRFHDLPYLVFRVPGSAGGSLEEVGRCHYAWRLALPGRRGFSATMLADSLARAAPCQSGS